MYICLTSNQLLFYCAFLCLLRIDLTDLSVQQMLHDLQEKERSKANSSDGSEPLNEDFDASVQSIDSLLKSMTNAQIAQMLAREGIDYNKITDRDQFLETARQVLETKLNSSTSPEKKSYFVPICLMAAAWAILRLYTTGGLSFVYRIFVRGFTGEDIESGSPLAGVDDLFG